MIRLEAVCFAREGRAVLDEVTLGVAAGEVVVVSGGRGAGKSALAAIAAARRLPDRGRVWIAERDVAGLQRSSLPYVRRNIGFASADAPLVDDETALDNVMLVLAVRGESVRAARAAAELALAEVDAAALAARTVAKLSAAERQLVRLARAIAGAPAVLVIDEPTAGLGPEDRGRVVDVLVAARDRGAAVLAASADEACAAALAARGARRARLERGRIAGGSPAISLVPDATTASSEEMPALTSVPASSTRVQGGS